MQESLKLAGKHNIAYASFFRRIIAATIDLLAFTIIVTPILNFAEWVVYSGNTPSALMTEFIQIYGKDFNTEELTKFIQAHGIVYKYISIQAISLTLLGMFFITLWYYTGTTLGKVITRCKVVNAGTLDPPNLKQCILRFLGYILSAIPLCFGFIAILFTKYNQGFHDKLAGTLVITHSRFESRKYGK